MNTITTATGSDAMAVDRENKRLREVVVSLVGGDTSSKVGQLVGLLKR